MTDDKSLKSAVKSGGLSILEKIKIQSASDDGLGQLSNCVVHLNISSRTAFWSMIGSFSKLLKYFNRLGNPIIKIDFFLLNIWVA